MADVSPPPPPPHIIGADFLAHFNLLVDMANRLLVNTSTLASASTSIAAAPADLALQITDTSDAYSSLKSSYPEVFHPVLHLTPRTSAEHGIYHHIKNSGLPIFSKFRRLAPDNCKLPKRSSATWKQWASAKRLQALGPLLSTSSQKRTVHYAPATIIDISTW